MKPYFTPSSIIVQAKGARPCSARKIHRVVGWRHRTKRQNGMKLDIRDRSPVELERRPFESYSAGVPSPRQKHKLIVPQVHRRRVVRLEWRPACA